MSECLSSFRLSNIPCMCNISIYRCVYTYTCTHSLFIHSPVDGHLGRFCLLATVGNTAENTGIQVSVLSSCFQSFRGYTQEGTCSITWQGLPFITQLRCPFPPKPKPCPSGGTGLSSPHSAGTDSHQPGFLPFAVFSRVASVIFKRQMTYSSAFHLPRLPC